MAWAAQANGRFAALERIRRVACTDSWSRGVLVSVMARERSSVSMDQTEAWRTHGIELIRYATLLVGPNDAADVVSVAFAKVMGAERPHVHDIRSYLMRSVFNAALDQHRSTMRRQVREIHAVLPESASPDEPSLDVRVAVAALSVQQRAVVYFTYWEDMTSAQVADVLRISPASARRHLTRARGHLRKVLQ